MKKLFILITLTLSIVGCQATTKSHVIDPYPNVNMTYVQKNCKDVVETYQVPSFGLVTYPVRFKNCAGVDDLFVIAWKGENTEIEKTTSKLISLVWTRFNNDKTKETKVKPHFIRMSSAKEPDGDVFWGSFYHLKPLPTPKKQNKTK